MSYDVIIVGGGPSGSILAIALGSSGLSVAVVDRLSPEDSISKANDGRAFAVAQGSADVMRKYHMWNGMEVDTQTITDIMISDDGGPGYLHYTAEDAGNIPMGYMLEHWQLRQHLEYVRKNYRNISWFAPASVTKIDFNSANVTVHLQGGLSLKAQVLVGADGRNSQMRELGKFKTTSWKYDQKAIVCKISHTKPHMGVAYEHFMPNGPFACLPMPGDYSAVVWTDKPDIVDSMMNLNDNDFTNEMQKRFGQALGDFKLASPKWSYPLGIQFVHKYISTRLALVADAAHVMHPVAGQGLNMGIRDVGSLADILIKHKKLGADIGQHVVLEQYQRARRFDNALMLGSTDGLIRLFSSNFTPVRVARSLGLSVVNSLPMVRKFFARQAMGR